MKIFVTILFIISISFQSFAWWPATHYSLARDVGYSHDEAGAFNLPDAWDSYNWLGSITDDFCWSHSVKRAGTTNLIPNIPVYDVSREPGAMMKMLIDNSKIIWDNNNTLAKAQKTARYFRGHNAADNNVHWAYFLGGGSLSNWTVQHSKKEEWAEYEIFLLKHPSTPWNSNGTIRLFWGVLIDHNNNNQIIVPINKDSISPWIIQLSQKIARKSRIELDTSEPTIWNSFDTINSLNSKIDDLQDKVNESIKKMEYTEYQDLVDYANENHWQLNMLLFMYNGAKINMQNWLNQY